MQITAASLELDVIRKNAESGEPAAGKEEEPLRLVIRRFSLRRGQIDTTAVGGKQVELKLPPLRLDDIGAPQGATPGEIGKIVVRAMTRQVATAVASHQLGSYLERKIDDKLDGEAAEAVKDLLRAITE